MKKQKKEIKNLNTIEELRNKLRETEKELFNMQVDSRLRKLKDVKSLNFKKKEIAIINTRIREKELNNAG